MKTILLSSGRLRVEDAGRVIEVESTPTRSPSCRRVPGD